MLIKKFSYKIFYLENFSAHNINKKINQIDKLNRKEILIGSGVSEKIKDINLIAHRTNLGNSFETLKYLNDPKKIFSLLESKKIKIPEWSIKKPKNTAGWLIKNINSAGGTSVQNATTFSSKSNDNFYYQKFLKGKNISIQFYVKKNKPQILLACNQWTCPSKKYPYLMGGIVSTNLTPKLFSKIKEIIKVLCSLIEFNGFNSIDFLVSNDIQPFIIDINPRPGLAINILYRIYGDSLFKKIKKKHSNGSKKFYCSSIVYSDKKIMINNKQIKILKNFSKSKNFTELPTKDCLILKHQPVCLVHSSSFSEKAARKRVDKLSGFIINKLNNYNNINV